MRALIFGILLITTVTFGQDKKEEIAKFNPHFSLGATYSNFFGNNYLSEGHRNDNYGFFIKLNAIQIYKFNIGGLFDKTGLKATDKAIGGNVGTSNLNTANVYLNYNINLNNHVSIEPEMKYGGVEIRQSGFGKKLGTQFGKIYGIGTNINYKIDNSLSFFISINYNKLILDVATTPEFESYFDNSNSLNLSLGIKL
jgi:hypothetical protein